MKLPPWMKTEQLYWPIKLPVRLRNRPLVPHVGWVCHLFSSLLRRFFSGSSSFPLSKEPTFQILIQPGNSGQEEPPRGMSTDEFHSYSPPILTNTMRCNLHCPPATHLIPIHHRQTIVVWWYTWRKDTWLFFLRRRKNICQKNKPQLALIWRVLMQRLANNNNYLFEQ